MKKLVNTIFITGFVIFSVSFVNAESYDGYNTYNPADNCYTERCDPYSEYQDPYSESYIPSCELTGAC